MGPRSPPTAGWGSGNRTRGNPQAQARALADPAAPQRQGEQPAGRSHFPPPPPHTLGQERSADAGQVGSGTLGLARGRGTYGLGSRPLGGAGRGRALPATQRGTDSRRSHLPRRENRGAHQGAWPGEPSAPLTGVGTWQVQGEPSWPGGGRPLQPARQAPPPGHALCTSCPGSQVPDGAVGRPVLHRPPPGDVTPTQRPGV